MATPSEAQLAKIRCDVDATLGGNMGCGKLLFQVGCRCFWSEGELGSCRRVEVFEDPASRERAEVLAAAAKHLDVFLLSHGVQFSQ